MTTLTVPAAPAVRPAPLTRLVRIELLKLTSTRLPYGLLAASAGFTALFTVIEAIRAGTSGGPAALTGYAGQSASTAGGVWSLLLAAVLGATISSSEFRHHTATLTYLATPGRGRVLAAKTAAGGVPLGTASFGPGRGAENVAALPFAAGVALLAAIALAGTLAAARTTVRRDTN